MVEYCALYYIFCCNLYSFSVVMILLLLPRSSNGLSTLHNKGSSALQVPQAAVEFLAHDTRHNFIFVKSGGTVVTR